MRASIQSMVSAGMTAFLILSVNHVRDLEFRDSGLWFLVADLQDYCPPQHVDPLKVPVVKPESSGLLSRVHLELLNLAPV
jgi:hypothetical protein